jgi:hypothetical protein
MAPEEVADRVLEAVRHDRFYVITHESSLTAIEARMKAVVDQATPPFAMP